MEKIKKFQWFFIGITIGGIIAAIIMSFFVKTKIKIVKETQTKNQYIKVPTTNEEAKQCAMSPIVINGSISNNIMKIIAQDECKKAEKEFTLSGPPVYKKNLIQPIVLYDFPSSIFLYGAIYQRSFGFFSIGGGAYYGNKEHFGIIGVATIQF